MRNFGVSDRQECGRGLNNRAENLHQPFGARKVAMTWFRDIKIIKKFAAVRASIYNHFNLNRNLTCRDFF